jgi:hypothetical protein
LVFPSPLVACANFDVTRPRDARSVTKEFVRRARKLGFPTLRLHDRGRSVNGRSSDAI